MSSFNLVANFYERMGRLGGSLQIRLDPEIEEPMTAPSDPGHSGLRPLSPYGEGYCRKCLFVVGLDHLGRLEPHSRNNSIYRDERQECKGSGTKPPKVTPYASRKAAFRVTAPDVWCPGCKQWVASIPRHGTRVYAQHGCALSGRPVQKDHSGERG